MNAVTVRWGAVAALLAYSMVVVQVAVHSPFPSPSLLTATLAALAGLVAFGVTLGLIRLIRGAVNASE